MNIRLATDEDDALIRKMLRENVLPSWVSMTMEREPSFFHTAGKTGEEKCILVFDGATPVGMYTCVDHAVYVNGEVANLGYLAGFRVNGEYRNRFKFIKAGYQSLAEFVPNRKGYWYTCIANENRPARKMLEAGLKDIPAYKGVGSIETLALPTSRKVNHGMWQPASERDMDDICLFYNSFSVKNQFSPVLTKEKALNIRAPFFVYRTDGQLRACMALWNQQNFKQCVARGYRFPLSVLLPVYNCFADLMKLVKLPPINRQLNQSFLAFFMADVDERAYIKLLEDALCHTESEAVAFTLNSAHPFIHAIKRHFKPASYAAQVYTVSYQGDVTLSGSPVNLEGSML